MRGQPRDMPGMLSRMPGSINSFPIAAHLPKHSGSTVMLSGGTIYREQNIILSPFEAT